MKTGMAAALMLGAIAVPGVALAADVALLVANRFYDGGSNAPQARAVESLAPDLEAAGYEVTLHVDLNSAEFARIAGETTRIISEADRLLIVLGGQVVQTPRDGFLVLTDAGPVAALSLGGNAVSIGALMDIASAATGPVVVAVGDSRWPLASGTGITDGYVPADLPEGVTVLTGAPNLLARFIATELLTPGQSIRAAAARAPASGVTVFGARPDVAMFPEGGLGVSVEESIWARAEQEDTVLAYEDYLGLYPAGQFAALARERIARLTETPEERAARVEEALGLDGPRRRAIQRDLAVLGHYDKDIDGLFGPGTRSGIAGWQAMNGFEVTGFLSANQIALLSQQASARAEALRAERERQDRQYWIDTGQGRDEAGLRAYLERFGEDGIYAALARERLEAIEAERRAEAEAADRAAWEAAQAANTVDAYGAYLAGYPDGLFAEDAQAAIAELRGDRLDEAERLRAMREEQGLNLVPTGRMLIERRLMMLGMEPGRIDGIFDPETRDAIRRYQESRALPVSGFITQATLVRILAEVVRR